MKNFKVFFKNIIKTFSSNRILYFCLLNAIILFERNLFHENELETIRKQELRHPLKRRELGRVRKPLIYNNFFDNVEVRILKSSTLLKKEEECRRKKPGYNISKVNGTSICDAYKLHKFFCRQLLKYF